MTTSVAASAYVFGVVSAGTTLPEVDETGLAEGLRLVEAGGLAAVVGTPPADRSIGRAADLMAHDRVLAGLVDAGTAVLPMRFGAVLRDDAAVVDELLTARGDILRSDLDRVTGRVQFTLAVRYEQDVVLPELLAARPDIARLRNSGATDSLDGRIRLGELVVQALDQARPGDAQRLLDELRHAVEVRLNKTSAPEEVLNAAVLVDDGRAVAFERATEKLAERHHPRLRMRLVGPSAPYDFVGTG